MRIGIDISRYFDKSGGIGIYAANLLKYLLKIDKNNEYNAYSFFYDCFPPNWKDKRMIGRFKRISKRIVFAQTNLPTTFLKKKWINSSIEYKEKMLGNVDIIHSTAYMIPELFNSKLIVTIHDLSFLIFPEYHTQENYQLVLKNLIYLNSRPYMVICDSEQTKKDVIKYFHVPEEKLKVIYLGVDDKFTKEVDKNKKAKVLKKYNLAKDYLLCVSSIEPRKNFLRIINVFSQLIKKKEYRNLRLVCVGGKGWKNTEIYEKVKKKNLESVVRFLGYLEEDELPHIYNGAKLFLYPSLYEGFGLPVLEAMARKVPVVTSNVSSLPEVAGDAAIMINPYSEKELFDSMLALLENDEKRGELISRGIKNAKRFNWGKTAKNTLQVYKEVYKNDF
ncbi:MAG: glycosyltransferase family 4 protein [Clostridiaceae bacterium]|nr:glycosyltransferase family 4 protein [Clostridiaceae bacterium]